MCVEEDKKGRETAWGQNSSNACLNFIQNGKYCNCRMRSFREVLAVEAETTSLATAFVSFGKPWMGKLTLPVPAIKLKHSSFLYHRGWPANWHWMVALWWQSLSGHGHHTHDELEVLGLSRSHGRSGLWKTEILKNCSPLMKISRFQQS